MNCEKKEIYLRGLRRAIEQVNLGVSSASVNPLRKQAGFAQEACKRSRGIH